LLLDIVVLFTAIPFQVYGTSPAFLPLLDAKLGLAFRNHTYDSQQLFLNFKDILETMPSYLQFHSWKQEEITIDEIR
jgi:hypothetical protein